MSDNPNAKKAWWKRWAGTLFGWIIDKGWKQWALLVVALVFVIWALGVWRGGVDYTKDPSALVPRSAHLYLETRDLDSLLKIAGNWPLWTNDRRNADDERWNRLQEDMADALSRRVAGLGRRLPLNWLSGTQATALSVSDNENGTGYTWALYLHLQNPQDIISEIAVEAGVTLENVKGDKNEGVYALTSTAPAKVYLGALGPWLIISSDSKLPFFALDGYRKPALTLARSNIIPQWSRSQSFRGMANPAHFPTLLGDGKLAPFKEWMSPDSRLSFSATLKNSDSVKAEFTFNRLSDQIAGGLWPLLDFVILVVGAFAFLLLLLIVFAMFKGSMLKAGAIKAGIVPAPAPEKVEPSAAFVEDAGGAPALSSHDDGVKHSPEGGEHEATVSDS